MKAKVMTSYRDLFLTWMKKNQKVNMKNETKGKLERSFLETDKVDPDREYEMSLENEESVEDTENNGKNGMIPWIGKDCT